MYVDYKDIELLKKLVNRHGRIVGRRKSGCNAASQHAVTKAIKRARFMALLPYVGNLAAQSDPHLVTDGKTSFPTDCCKAYCGLP